MYVYGGCSKLWYPKTFRAPAESGQGIVIMFSCAYIEIKTYRRQEDCVENKEVEAFA